MSLPHLLGVFPRTGEVRESGITSRSLEASHLAGVCLKLPNEFLKPRVADTELPGPITTRGPAASRQVNHQNTNRWIIWDSSGLRHGLGGRNFWSALSRFRIDDSYDGMLAPSPRV